MKAYLFLLFCLMFEHGFGQTVSLEQYFPLKKGKANRFYVHHLTKTDTINDKDAVLVCQSIVVKGREIYFFSDVSHTKDDDLISPNTFCAGVFYYDQGTFLFSPLSWTHEVKEANLAYFDTLFPSQLLLHTPYKHQDGEEKRTYTFVGFENISIAKTTYSDCLKLVVMQDWPTSHYADTVWFEKGLGVVKWLRGTGRLEELKPR
jgi:hypothetical protein